MATIRWVWPELLTVNELVPCLPITLSSSSPGFQDATKAAACPLGFYDDSVTHGSNHLLEPSSRLGKATYAEVAP